MTNPPYLAASRANKTVPLVLTFLLLISATHAAIVDPSEDTILTNRGGGPFTIGFDFSVDVDVKINALGVEDSLNDGLTIDSSAGLWRLDPAGGASELLATVLVPAGDEPILENGFRYVLLDQVITLNPGNTYRIGATVGGDNPFTDTVDQGGGGQGYSGASVEILVNRFAVGAELLEPVNDGTAALGRWVGGNATFLGAAPPSTTTLVQASEDTILTNRGGGPFTIGFDFSVDVDVKVNALGVEDSLNDGLTIDSSAGLWRVDSGGGESELLATVLVPAGDEPILENGFRYVLLDQVITLTPGNTYRIGAMVGGDNPFTDTVDQGGGGQGYSGDSVEILVNRFAVGAELLEPVNDGTAALGRWVGGNAAFIGSDSAEDTDGDGISDIWENAFGLDKDDSSDGSADPDEDGMTSLQEFFAQTDPLNPDSDGDGLNDGVETDTGVFVSSANTGTSPRIKDSDDDGLDDNVETSDTATNPNMADSDRDGFSDGFELQHQSDPIKGSITPITLGGSLLAYFDFEDTGTVDVAASVAGGIEAVINLPIYETGSGRDGNVMGFVADGNLVVEDASSLNIASSVDKITVAFWQNSFVLSGVTFAIEAPAGAFSQSARLLIGDPDVIWDTSRPSAADDGSGFFHRLTVNPVDSIDGFDPYVWHHWAVVKDGEHKSIWIDGVKVGENEGAAPLNTDMSALFIGSAINGSQFLDGQLDDFAVFARALSGEEINQLAGGTLPNELSEPAPPAAVDLIVQISSNADEVTITWDAPGTKLQSTANVSDSASWVDVSNATSPYTKVASEAQEFFRIVNP